MMIATLLSPVRSVGRVVLATAAAAGAVTLFAGRALTAAATPPFFGGQVARQLMRIGYFSLPVVGLTAIFTGASLALNIISGTDQAQLGFILPAVIGLGIIRELGPVLAALMLAGRVSAAIAAEIGTMRVTEQIDALTTLSTSPYRYLIAPRVAAGLIAMPLLVIVADIIGVLGGYVIATQVADLNGEVFLQRVDDTIDAGDIMSGLIKAAVFGLLLTLMGCYHGYTSRGGAQGVGRATTNAVASAMILIIAANYVLGSVLLDS